MAFKDDMQIDDSQLMFEVTRQAHLFHQCAEDYADAQYEQEKTKSALDTIKARIDEEIRADPETYGLTTDKKPTESAISNQVIQSADYQKANNSLMEANHIVRRLGAAKDAFAQKKSMLEAAVKLFLTDWNSDPSMPPKVREAESKAGVAEHKAALSKGKLGKAGSK